MLESWRNKPLDDREAINLMNLLGKPCLVGISHGKSANGNAYAKITGISNVPKGMGVPKPLTPIFEWHVGSGDFQAPDWLPFLYGEPVEDVIKRSVEFAGAKRVGPGPAVPFGAPPGPAPVAVPVGAGAPADDGASTDPDSDDCPF
jgi:hypothetical protein